MNILIKICIIVSTSIRIATAIEDYDRVLEIFASQADLPIAEQKIIPITSLIPIAKEAWNKRINYIENQNSLWRRRESESLGPEDYIYTSLGKDSCETLQSYWNNFKDHFEHFKTADTAFKQALTNIRSVKTNIEIWELEKNQLYCLAYIAALELKIEEILQVLQKSFIRKVKELKSQTTLITYPSTGYLWTVLASSARKISRVYNEGSVIDSAPDFISHMATIDDLMTTSTKPFLESCRDNLLAYPPNQYTRHMRDRRPNLLKALETLAESLETTPISTEVALPSTEVAPIQNDD